MPVSENADGSGFDPKRYGPWAVIAGGSEGVGASFAHQLADAGINVVLIARKPGPLEETAEEVRARGVQALTLSADLTDPSVIDEIISVTDDLDVGLFIYNAGANTYGNDFVEGDLERFQTVIDLNITAQLALVHHFGARLRARGEWRVVARRFHERLPRRQASLDLRCREGLWARVRRVALARAA